MHACMHAHIHGFKQASKRRKRAVGRCRGAGSAVVAAALFSALLALALPACRSVPTASLVQLQHAAQRPHVLCACAACPPCPAHVFQIPEAHASIHVRALPCPAQSPQTCRPQRRGGDTDPAAASTVHVQGAPWRGHATSGATPNPQPLLRLGWAGLGSVRFGSSTAYVRTALRAS